jgi:hypothetical protein
MAFARALSGRHRRELSNVIAGREDVSVPCSSNTRMLGSCRVCSMVSASTPYISFVKAFFLSGRASVTVRTPSISSMRISEDMVAFQVGGVTP